MGSGRWNLRTVRGRGNHLRRRATSFAALGWALKIPERWAAQVMVAPLANLTVARGSREGQESYAAWATLAGHIVSRIDGTPCPCSFLLEPGGTGTRAMLGGDQKASFEPGQTWLSRNTLAYGHPGESTGQGCSFRRLPSLRSRRFRSGRASEASRRQAGVRDSLTKIPSRDS